jgi:anti-sigma B factor antagonist
MVEVEVAQQPEGFVLVRLAGEIDMSQAVPVRHAFRQALGAGRAAVLIDLCDLRFLAVSGVDEVDAAVAELTDQGRSVAVVCTDRGPVARIVTLLGLDRRWPLHHDLAPAIAGLVRKG